MIRALTPQRVAPVILEVQAVLTPDLLHPNYQEDAQSAIATTGHCCTASEALYFLLGGPLARLKSLVAAVPDGTTHWWLQGPDGVRYDPTEDQYRLPGEEPPYHLGRPCGFMGMRQDPRSPWGFQRRPSKRAALILDRVLHARRTR